MNSTLSIDGRASADELSIAGADRYQAGKLIEAEQLLRLALALEPKNADRYYNLGVVIHGQVRKMEAIELYRQAIDLNPNYINAWINLGIVLKEERRVKEAIDVLDRAITLDPAHANAQYNLGLALLLDGRLTEGFAKYEYRFKIHHHLTICQPDIRDKQLWNGENMDGENLLICHEQGIGDAIQFIRYVQYLQAYNFRLTIATHPALQRLFSTCLDLPNSSIVTFNDLDASLCDRYVSLLSLPHIFKTNLDSIPNFTPYIHPPKYAIELQNFDRISKGEALPTTGLRVGLVWATDPQNKQMYRHKSIRAEGVFNHLKSFLIDRSISIYSLQVGEAAAWIKPYLDLPNVCDLSDRLNDFTDTAAIIDRLDLVITVDTAVAHLAGAMGKPVWILLPFEADWRWLLNRNDSPWYPTMRLFRQIKSESWGAVLDNIESALLDLIQSGSIEIDYQLKLTPKQMFITHPQIEI
jgi:Tetratricopeptide repeat/Glycosyltransferase family 9 (heptosyltransferase)